jgi:hypothetical protein
MNPCCWKFYTYLPVLGISGKHHGVFRLADLARIVILNLLDNLFGLDAVIFREGSLVTSSAGMGEEVWADWLNATLGGLGKVTKDLEVLLGLPTRRKGGERNTDVGNHYGLNGYFCLFGRLHFFGFGG